MQGHLVQEETIIIPCSENGKTRRHSLFGKKSAGDVSLRNSTGQRRSFHHRKLNYKWSDKMWEECLILCRFLECLFPLETINEASVALTMWREIITYTVSRENTQIMKQHQMIRLLGITFTLMIPCVAEMKYFHRRDSRLKMESHRISPPLNSSFNWRWSKIHPDTCLCIIGRI